MSRSVTATEDRGTVPVYEDVEWLWSIGTGVVAWVVGLVATFGVVTVAEAATRPVAGSDPSTLKVASWIYHASIGGMVNTPISGGVPFMGTTNYNVTQFATTNSDYWGAAVFGSYLIPVVVLIVAGYALARRHRSKFGHGPTFDQRKRALFGGLSMVIGFAALTILSTFVFTARGLSFDSLRMVTAAVVYPMVFVGLGAGMGAGISTRSLDSFLAGIGAFVLGVGLYFVVGNSALGSLSNFPGLAGDLAPVLGYLTEHSFVGERFPEWYVAAVMLLAGGAVAWNRDASDPLTGAGQGARIAWGYFPLAFLGIGVWMVAYLVKLRELAFQSRQELIDLANATLGGVVPEVALLAGVVLPFAFGGVGGAGAVLVKATVEGGSTRSHQRRGSRDSGDGGRDRRSDRRRDARQGSDRRRDDRQGSDRRRDDRREGDQGSRDESGATGTGDSADDGHGDGDEDVDTWK